MKPKYISYDKAFEKKFEKYKSKLTDGEKDKLRKRFEIFKENILLDDCGVYFLEIGSHDVCY